MSQTASDDGFHEIQLNGKQLVFLFMAATVVSVVIFLCGVLVGRGVRAERGNIAESSASNDATPAEIAPNQPPTPTTLPAPGSDPTAAAPPPNAEDLSYFKRLEDPKAPQEQLKPTPVKATSPQAASAAAAPAPVAEAPKTPAPAKQPAQAQKAAASTAASAAPANDSASASGTLQPPTGPGFAVQIAALSVRSEADAIAKHLSAKGYAAYVAANGSPAIYRVRIGTFKTRREAESMVAKLQKEEQLKPFITR